MSNVASLELSKRLHELSGWDNTFASYDWIDDYEPSLRYPELERRYGLFGTNEVREFCPAYDAGYLLRMLPRGTVLSAEGDTYAAWKTRGADLFNFNGNKTFSEAETPEDALALLAIKLFEEGVLEGGDD